MNLSPAIWKKSSRSGSQGNCVEVATNLPRIVGVRDSKNPEPTLVFSREDWRDFLSYLTR